MTSFYSLSKSSSIFLHFPILDSVSRTIPSDLIYTFSTNRVRQFIRNRGLLEAEHIFRSYLRVDFIGTFAFYFHFKCYDLG